MGDFSTTQTTTTRSASNGYIKTNPLNMIDLTLKSFEDFLPVHFGAGGAIVVSLYKLFAVAIVICLVLHWFKFPKGLDFFMTGPSKLMLKLKPRTLDEQLAFAKKQKEDADKAVTEAVKVQLDAQTAVDKAKAPGTTGATAGGFFSGFKSGISPGGSGINNAVQDTQGSVTPPQYQCGGFDPSSANASQSFLDGNRDAGVNLSSFGTGARSRKSAMTNESDLRLMAY